ncbi:universal stress protein [Megalodesulfovibrio gigas]|uniref:universal stress protein n=1 Tax=Megalodesulfovibrio gigas TaxID=879 RepID=UPI000407AE8C|nr:universal stress protein [Megalodesulfovibrio gigas]
MIAAPHVQTIIAAVDMSPVTAKVVGWAMAQARAFNAQLELLYVTTPEPDFIGYAPGPQHERNAVACRMQDEQRALAALKAQVAAQGLKVSEHVFPGVPEDKILQEAHRLQADLIICGRHDHDFFYRLFVGSVGEELLKRSPCPILFVPADPLSETDTAA